MAFLLVILQTVDGDAASISVQAQVDKQQVTVGESFILQIKIEGDDAPAEPDLSGLKDFIVQPRGGGPNNRESITIINGRMNRVSEHGYVFRYLLTPKRDGTLTIPAIEINAGGKTLLTQPVPISVAQPITSNEFKLFVSLSETESYVGQPLVLTVKWYVNRNIADFKFDLPFLEDYRFTFADLKEDSNYQGQDAVPVNLPGGKVIARKGREGLHGLEYATVTLRKIVIPREAGEFAMGRGTVFSKIVTGYQQRRGSRPFDDLFDDVFGRREPMYKQLVTESNDLRIKVLPLPDAGRPTDFTGLVGQYSLAAEASPTEVNVGDPITLNIMVAGADYLDNVVLPPLHNQQALRDNFKVPEEMAPGEIDGRVKVYTHTIRAKHPEVKEIPAISLNYFNPETGSYETATSNAIPLQVKATKILTARDAEGTVAGISKSELTSLNRGIAHNYVGEDLLKSQEVEISTWLRSPAGLLLILFPPGLYLLVLVPVYLKRKRLFDRQSLQAQKALVEFSRELKRLEKSRQRNELQPIVSGLVEAMRVYLGKRLQMPPGALVYSEVAARLQDHGIDDSLLAELQDILDRCEAYHYGAADSNSSREDVQQLFTRALTLFKKLDQCLKQQPGMQK